MITTNELIRKYGQPTETGLGYLIPISLPYPMKLAWDLNTKVTTIRCHRLVADRLKEVFNELLLVYGLNKIQEFEQNDNIEVVEDIITLTNLLFDRMNIQ